MSVRLRSACAACLRSKKRLVFVRYKSLFELFRINAGYAGIHQQGRQVTGGNIAGLYAAAGHIHRRVGQPYLADHRVGFAINGDGQMGFIEKLLEGREYTVEVVILFLLG